MYDLVSAKLEEKESQAVKLLPRLTKYFVHGENNKNLGVCVPHFFNILGHERESDKKQIMPRFPPEMWSCYSRVLESKPSTTNFLEGNHRGYDYKFMKDHPSKLLFPLYSIIYFIFQVSRTLEVSWPRTSKEWRRILAWCRRTKNILFRGRDVRLVFKNEDKGST